MTVVRKDSWVLRSVRKKVMDIFGADLRSLAVFRLVLALLVLSDLANRASDLSAHYTGNGILPRAVLIEEVLDNSKFSLNLANGEPTFQAFLFGVTALAALGMLVGYRTRLMTGIVWLLLLSIQYRNPLMMTGGDTLLRILLFWSIFLPLGAYWSVDRALQAAPPRLSMRFFSFATVGLFMQIAFVYWFTAIIKWSRSPEWQEGTALYYALSVDRLPTPIGAYLLQFPKLLAVLTVATLALEAFGPFLLFSPFFTGPVRTVAVMAFMSLHFGIWLTMYIGFFPFVSAFCMVCFLPSWFWDKLAAEVNAVFPEQPNIVRRLRHTVARPINYSWSSLKPRLASVAGGGQHFVVNSGVRGNGDLQQGYAASVTSPSDPGTVSPPDHLGPTAEESDNQETNHDTIASRSEPAMLRPSPVINLLAALLLLWVFCYNLTTVSGFSMPERLSALGSFLGLAQEWKMFAPPPHSGGWHVIPGTLRNGQQVDLMPVTRDDFRPHEVSWKKPQYVASIYENHRWRRYMASMSEADNEEVRPYFGAYICREWNARHEGSEELMSLQGVYMVEQTLPDNRSTTPRKTLLWEQSCS